MTSIDDLDDPPAFNKHEWLRKDKIYSPSALPYFVVEACTKALAVPQQVKKYFPSHDISVLDLLKKNLPLQSSAPNIIKPEAWFSMEAPNGNLDIQLTQKIPSDQLITELGKIAGQKWSDGAQSLVDHRIGGS